MSNSIGQPFPELRCPLPSRWFAALVGVGGLAAVIALGITAGIPSYQRHLRNDVTRSVLATGVRVALDGRTAVLSGTVASEDDKRELIEGVTARWGIDGVRADGVRIATVSNATNSNATNSDATNSGATNSDAAKAGTSKPGGTRTSSPVAPNAGSPPVETTTSSVVVSSSTTSPSTSTSTTRPPTSTSTTRPPTSTSTTRPPTTTTTTRVATTTSTVAPRTTTTTRVATTTTAVPTTTTSTTSTTTTLPPPLSADAALALQDQLDAIRAAGPISFVKSGITLTPEALASLAQVASVLQVTPGLVQIQAFTDSRGIPARNVALSAKRAATVKAALVQAGVPAQLLIPVGRGATSPVASNATAAGQAANRRIEFVVLGGPKDPTATTA